MNIEILAAWAEFLVSPSEKIVLNKIPDIVAELEVNPNFVCGQIRYAKDVGNGMLELIDTKFSNRECMLYELT